MIDNASSVHLLKSNCQYRSESGAVLIVAIILVSITISLGIVSMRENNYGQRLVANDLFYQDVFRSAESAADNVVTDENLITVINNIDQELTVDHIDDETTRATGTLSYIGTSLSIGNSLAKFNVYNVQAVGRADIDSVDAVSQVILGSTRLAPSL